MNKKSFTILNFVIVLLCITLSYICYKHAKDNRTRFEMTQMLTISVCPAPNAGATNISPTDLGGNYNSTITYYNVCDVNISIDKKRLTLEDAICQGLISIDEIFAYARIDARNGFCQESFNSINGLTHFTYRYPEFDLRIIYDVYETPDGQQHLINDFGIYEPFTHVFSTYTDEDNKYNYALDREDWGLTFTVTHPSFTGISVHCRQSGGQQIGQLKISWYSIRNQNGFVPNLEGTEKSPSLEQLVKMDGETAFTINWQDHYGELPSGNYQITFHVLDEFDESQVHPLMRDYHDWQYYILEFTIP